MRAQDFLPERVNDDTIKPGFHAEKTAGELDLQAEANEQIKLAIKQMKIRMAA